GVGEEVAANDAVDALHFFMEHAARLVGGSVVRQPAVIEERDPVRDDALGERARELEKRIGGEAIAQFGDGLAPLALLPDHADRVEILEDHEVHVVQGLRQTADGKRGAESDCEETARSDPADKTAGRRVLTLLHSVSYFAENKNWIPDARR